MWLGFSKMIEKNKKVFLWEVEMYFEKDFVKYIKNWTELKVSWQNLKLEENWNYIYLYTSTISALLIPINKIDNIKNKEEFLKNIRNNFN
jgi:hypothetical protein